MSTELRIILSQDVDKKVHESVAEHLERLAAKSRELEEKAVEIGVKVETSSAIPVGVPVSSGVVLVSGVFR